MLLFKRILNFKRDALARLRDKRKAKRYPVGPEFPLKASVNLTGLPPSARTSAPAVGSGRDWSGRLANISIGGVSLQLPPSAMTARGEKTLLVLTIENHRLEIPCTVAHFRVAQSVATCGLALEFPDLDTQKAYLQLLEAVALGAEAVALKPKRSARHPAGLTPEQYASGSRAQITAWRRPENRQLDSFEFLFSDHCLRGEAAGPVFDVYTRQKTARGDRTALSAPGLSLSAGAHAELRQLFRWVVANLPRTVPLDLRQLMRRCSETGVSAAIQAARAAEARFFPAPVRTRPPLTPA